MKKALCILLTSAAILTFYACGNTGQAFGDAAVPETAVQNTPTPNIILVTPQPSDQVSARKQSGGEVDIDLTKLSSTVVYSELFSIMYEPASYVGKTIKMKGQFSYYEDPQTKNQYFLCVITDAAACCSQGLGFTLAGEQSFPEDYPELGAEITIKGTFDIIYEENGYEYYQLSDTEFVE